MPCIICLSPDVHNGYFHWNTQTLWGICNKCEGRIPIGLGELAVGIIRPFIERGFTYNRSNWLIHPEVVARRMEEGKYVTAIINRDNPWDADLKRGDQVKILGSDPPRDDLYVDKLSAPGNGNSPPWCIGLEDCDLQQAAAEISLDSAKYPHTCPRCNSPAYIGINRVDCSAKCTEG
jgi:hypothetical protein